MAKKKLRSFMCRFNNGTYLRVKAATEQEARTFAMRERYGPENAKHNLWLGVMHYAGLGLMVNEE